VGITQPSAQPPSPARRPAVSAGAVVSAGAYVALFLLGLAEGLLGSFHYSRAMLGSVPLGAIAFALGILVTCVLAGWAMRGLPGALLPAIGWFVASFVLAMPSSGGSVIIASTSAGEWYLYGGSVGALLGVGSAFVTAGRRVTGGAGGGRNGPAA
jgi:uncharacterized membrane protein